MTIKMGILKKGHGMNLQVDRAPARTRSLAYRATQDAVHICMLCVGVSVCLSFCLCTSVPVSASVSLRVAIWDACGQFQE